MKGRTAVVTGASRGIGHAIAAELLGRGANVCLTARTEDTLMGAAEALGCPDRVLAIAGNTADAQHRDAVVSMTLERFGSLDMLVSNTGINPAFGALMTVDPDAFRKTLETNVVAALGWVQAVHAAWMGAHGGTVVNVTSAAGLRAAPGLGAYGASKAALSYLTQQLALELAPAVRVNAVAPAVVRTRFAAGLFEGREQEVASRYPLGRIGTPRDVAAAVGFLLSEQADWISGQVIAIDGGLLVTGGV